MGKSSTNDVKRVEHTPGPWCLQGQWATNKGIAECIEAEGWGIIGAWIDTSNEPDGNRHLIAAAPELLAALELAEATMMRLAKQHGPFNSAQGSLDVARAAIAKARGQ